MRKKTASGGGYKTALILLILTILIAIPFGLYQSKVKAEEKAEANYQLLLEMNKTIQSKDKQIDSLKQQGEEVKKQNEILKKQVNLPIRDKIIASINTIFGNKAQEALAVVSCENSTMDMAHINYNSNGTFDSGPFQLNSLHSKRFGTDFMVNAMENVKVAYTLWREQGWHPWISTNHCHHLASR